MDKKTHDKHRHHNHRSDKRIHDLALLLTAELIEVDKEKGLVTAALEGYELYSNLYAHLKSIDKNKAVERLETEEDSCCCAVDDED